MNDGISLTMTEFRRSISLKFRKLLVEVDYRQPTFFIIVQQKNKNTKFNIKFLSTSQKQLNNNKNLAR